MRCEVVQADCEEYLRASSAAFDLTFFDPPFNQNKEYNHHDDSMPRSEYLEWMKRLCALVYAHTSEGGAIYFMQREKNVQFVLEALQSAGWDLQNLIVWKKKTSAVPMPLGFGKHYQVIAFAIKGDRPRVFNKLRIDPPLLQTEKQRRPNGVFVTDVWDDIRELTSGYFAGEEPLRLGSGERAHKQQSPTRLLARIILSSSNPGDLIFDPFAGTGTALVVARQLQRESIGIEVDPFNAALIRERLEACRASDDLTEARRDYTFTDELDRIWPRAVADPRVDPMTRKRRES